MTQKEDARNMPFIERVLNLSALLQKKSHFLLGPRQTGKSFLIAHSLPDVRVYDLLDSATYLTLNQHPGRIAQELTPQDYKKWNACKNIPRLVRTP